MPETRFKRQLIAEANITNNHGVLDLGCGTATLSIVIKGIHPDSRVDGVDGDAKILEIGRRKTIKAGCEIAFAQAMSFDLPYSNASFDRVLSSLMFHHLTRENKVLTLKEVNRVLRSGGEDLFSRMSVEDRSGLEQTNLKGLASQKESDVPRKQMHICASAGKGDSSSASLSEL